MAELVKKPPVLGVVLAFALLLLDVKLPTVVMSAGTYISNTVTPLALIYSGFVIYEVGLRQLRFLPGLPAALIIRMVISPVICLMVCMLMGVHGLARDVFIVSAALPVIGQLTVFCGVYGADEQYAAIGSSLSVLSMFLTLPVIMLIL